MNHLAHFRVAWPDPGLVVGGFLGDFVKGRLSGRFPSAIERGIALHRAVDAYTDQHPVTRQSVSRFAPRFRRVGPIMVDVIYDHLLARYWQHKRLDSASVSQADLPTTSLMQFADSVFGTIDDCEANLPEAAVTTATRMRAARSLESYSDEAFIDRSFSYLGRRLKKETPLGEGFAEFKCNEHELTQDFMVFFPDLMAFSRQWQTKH